MQLIRAKHLHFIGLKGSGMCALALLLKKLGKQITGSDIADVFYTDALLADAKIECTISFAPSNIPTDTDLIIYSAAYSPLINAELAYAMQHYPYMVYPQALGALSREYPSCAVIGTHGKTTTTAFVGTLCKQLQLPLMVLTGGRVTDWDNNTYWYGGDHGLVAEVCEYRNHFKHFVPNFALYTSAEFDHPDYFKSEQEVILTFQNFLHTIKIPKKIIACLDDRGVRESIDTQLFQHIISYGFERSSENTIGDESQSAYKLDIKVSIHSRDLQDSDVKNTIDDISEKNLNLKKQYFTIKGLAPYADKIHWQLSVPGKALVLNAVAALIFIREWCILQGSILSETQWNFARDALAQFRGVSRRCELLYRDNGIVVLDDYAHHPTAIKMTLEGIVNFYNPKRLIVDFMPHTFTRTASLLDDFVQSFESADIVIINNIYGSAREQQNYQELVTDNNLPNIEGAGFVNHMNAYHTRVQYIPDFEQAAQWVIENLLEGDVFVSMGAGDNFRIAQNVARHLSLNRT